MLTIAYHTLGCKVNQYDTQAMEELLSAAGYRSVPFPGPADIYLINTCTVTGTGDKKSFQLIRRLKRNYPSCVLILCGCLAQLHGEDLLSSGADLVIGIQNRSNIVSLLEQVLSSGHPVCAVKAFPESLPFEPLRISRQEEHTRAVLKIQEGCNNRCTYCIIPTVRGPVRSRPLTEIVAEAERLAERGFTEIVLTGIHLSSYGKDLAQHISLLNVLTALQNTKGILRIRLGSLEPTIVSPSFAAAIADLPKVCPQFHLALQSGSDTVLQRMRRRYNTSQYLSAVSCLRDCFPLAALTTDILTGFPGETPDEFRETENMIRMVGFARIHVFPYSQRPGTPAASMPDQLSESEKQARARHLISVGNETALAYQQQWIGRESVLLPEEIVSGCWEGYTPEYLRVRLAPDMSCTSGIPVQIRIQTVNSRCISGILV